VSGRGHDDGGNIKQQALLALFGTSRRDEAARQLMVARQPQQAEVDRENPELEDVTLLAVAVTPPCMVPHHSL
jgi:hypothetical protein